MSISDKPYSEEELALLSLDELRDILDKRGDRGPSYLFNKVQDNKDDRDYQYVFWLDLMGARNAMKLSLPRAARSVMKIHAAALAAKQEFEGVEINPVMDGVYGFVGERKAMEGCLRRILTSLANVFIQEAAESNRFMVRAGVAFGPLIPGATLAAGAQILRDNKEYLGGTAIGMGISNAYEAESLASPFGVYIHESARAFAPRGVRNYPYRSNLWRWVDDDDPLSWALRRTLVEHFEWLHRNSVAAQYDLDALKRHRALADEYFELYRLPILGGGQD